MDVLLVFYNFSHFFLARTKIGESKIRTVRTRGGNSKLRALRLDHGSYSWGSQAFSAKTRILRVVYNSTNNEIVRQNALVKGGIVEIDATPFATWFKNYYGPDIGRPHDDTKSETKPLSRSVVKKQKARLDSQNNAGLAPDSGLLEQFQTGRLLACITSRPGQVGRADGYILEGNELAFYLKKRKSKKK